MEKTTKKKRKSKRLKRRIGLIAVGGLSLVLTVCLSVGATLAWFAGSTWASKDLYMGGPVYVEMAGRGNAGGTNADGSTANAASWKGGDGHLDILASGRTTGTADIPAAEEGQLNAAANSILLPGQKLLIYSQARVFSTAYYDNLDDGDYPNQSSGANTTNSNYTYTDQKGKVRTTTTSVLRAKFSINVEFDPYMGFNNFTATTYASHYPERTVDYTGDVGNGTTYATAASALGWEAALVDAAPASLNANGARRDNVVNSKDTTSTNPWYLFSKNHKVGLRYCYHESKNKTKYTHET